MTFNDFSTKIKSAGFSVAEAEFKKSVNTPFLVYFKGVDKSIHADGKLIYQNIEVILELYTEKTDTESQTKLERWLIENDLPFKMTERSWISEENFYMTVYKVNLL